MASVMDTASSALENWPKWDRKEQIKMRYSGQEYVSKSGKVIPAKKQPELICTCPQKCGDKISQEARERLFREFYRLSDHALQNRFLQAHIEIRAVQRRFLRQQQRSASGRSQRRVSCKYQVPLIQSASDVTFDGKTKPGIPIVEVCQKAFMNVYAITEKRVRIQRERLICQAQELAAAAGGSPLQQVDLLSPIGPRPIQPKLHSRGGENFYLQNQDVISSRATTLGNSNITITPRMSNSPLSHPRDFVTKLSDRDISLFPPNINSSLSIFPIRGENFSYKNSIPGVSKPNEKLAMNRDITMIPVSRQVDSDDDQAMPTDLSVRKHAVAIRKELDSLNMPAVTPAANQPVDLSVKSSRPKTYDEPEYKYDKYKFMSRFEFERAEKLEYESEAEMDGDEMNGHNDYDVDQDMEPGMEAGMDGDTAMEEAYEPYVDSELESRPGATPDSMHSNDLLQAKTPVNSESETECASQNVLFEPNSNDIALVTNFFQHQLWQPEYIDAELIKEHQKRQDELKAKAERMKEKKRKERLAAKARMMAEQAAAEKKLNEAADETENKESVSETPETPGDEVIENGEKQESEARNSEMSDENAEQMNQDRNSENFDEGEGSELSETPKVSSSDE